LKAMFKKYLPIILLVLILIYSGYELYRLADSFTQSEIERNGKGYVSDEVWYVSSARNILIKIFHVEPRNPINYSATIITNTTPSRGYVNSLAARYGVNVVDWNYKELKNAFYVESSSKENLILFIEEIRSEYGIIDVVYGWRLPDHDNIQNYMNTEHPPLGKYLIAFSIYLFGDYPTYWRYPSIASGILLLVLIYLITLKITGNHYLSLLVTLLASFDQLFRVMAAIAMLDIFVALFTALAVLLLLHRKIYLSILVAALASTFKFSGLFIAIPITIIFLRYELRNRGINFKVFSIGLIYSITIIALTAIIIQVLTAVPLIMGIGFSNWAQATIGSFKWHTSVKCTGAKCPISAAPWDWMLGINGFAVYFFTLESKAIAIGNPIVWPIVFGITLLFIPAYKVSRKSGWPILILYGLLAGYVLLWIIGGRTQYSFYAIQLLPYVYMSLIIIPYDLLWYREKALMVINKWIRGLKEIWRLLIKILL